MLFTIELINSKDSCHIKVYETKLYKIESGGIYYNFGIILLKSIDYVKYN